MTRRKRTMAIVLLCVLAVVVLSSVVCIAVNASHDCVSENCAKCAQLLAAGRTLEQLRTACAAVLLLVAMLAIVVGPLVIPAEHEAERGTLVSWKVKLSN